MYPVFMKSNLSFLYMYTFFYVLSKKSLPVLRLLRYSMFSYNSFIVLAFIFRSGIHLELIFVLFFLYTYPVVSESICWKIFPFPLNYLSKSLNFQPLSNIIWLYIGRSISGLCSVPSNSLCHFTLFWLL